MEAKLSGAASNVVQQRSWRALVVGPQEYSWKSLTEQIVANDAICGDFLELIDKETYQDQIGVLQRNLDNIASDHITIIELQRSAFAELQTGFQAQNRAEKKELERQCLDSLWTTNYENQKRFIDQRVPGTCV